MVLYPSLYTLALLCHLTQKLGNYSIKESPQAVAQRKHHKKQSIQYEMGRKEKILLCNQPAILPRPTPASSAVNTC